MTDKEALTKAFDELELEPVILATEEPSSSGEPDEVEQWKALLAEEHKHRMFLQWQLDKLIEQMLPINDDFIDDVLEDDDFERSKRLAFLQGVRWREAMYKLK
jgi:4-alpha-glucanotransferase